MHALSMGASGMLAAKERLKPLKELRTVKKSIKDTENSFLCH